MHNFEVDSLLSEIDLFEIFIEQVDSLLDGKNPILTNLSNLTALIKQTYSKISWVGFYLRKGENLYLATFQGKVACEVIKIGNGVCGISAERKEAILVENVHTFSGHIACESETNSELVIPIIVNQVVIGVLDLDSYQLAAFTEFDKKYFSRIIEILKKKVSLEAFEIG
jgi:GAF domain-containing protein